MYRYCQSLAPAVLALGTALLAPPLYAGEPLTLSDSLREVLRQGQPQNPGDLRLLQDQVRLVVETTRPATVAIEMNDSIGSGVIVSPEGLVLTAGHVSVEPNRKVWVRFADNTRVQAKSLGVNHPIDCSIVRITDPPSVVKSLETDQWPYAPIAETPAKAGDWVVGLGHPNGFVEDRAPPVRLGRVLYTKDGAINTDVTLVGGDSGGPLLNLRGEVVGIHSRIGERITSNFHVSISAYRREWDRLMEGRMVGVPDGEDPEATRPLVGVAVRDTDEGLVVTQVFHGSPAATAGVKPGDRITRLAGKPIGTALELNLVAGSLKPFDRVAISVVRDDNPMELQVWLGRTPIEFPGMAPEGRPQERRRRRAR